jgi:predicted esterase
MARPIRAAVGVLGVLALVALPAAAAAQEPTPDLKVSSGSLGLKDGRVKGSFTVRNAGSERSRSTSATLNLGGRALRRFAVPALDPGESKTVRVSLRKPRRIGGLRVCADGRKRVRERRERNNCRGVGRLRSGGSTVPKRPISFQKDKVFSLDSPASKYWIYVPAAYDRSHTKPISLLVWMHGCGGQGEGDIFTVSPGGDQSWISISLGGREGQCWDVNADQALVLAAIADVKTHFNVDPRRVVLGGYSSGGDLAYRTAFYHAKQFAGVLAENTSPFRDTGSSQADSLAAAAWKFHVVHLAHTEDETYPIAGVRQEVEALRSGGFPVELVERPGSHYDDSTATTGTDHDLQAYLLPHMDDGWRAPR